MNFQFEISGTVISEDPLQLAEWSEQAIYDRARGVLLIDLPNELTFAGDGYALIKSLYDSLGFYSTIEMIIRKQDSSVSPWVVVTKGQVPLTSCEFDLKECTVTVRITDETYNSKIRVNSEISTYVIDPKSKNGEDISAYLPTNLNMSLHNQTSGVYTTGYNAYDLLECLEHAARWMSDGTIGVVSNFYDGLETASSNPTDLHRIAIMTGEEIKQKNSGIPPVVSWDTLTEFTYRNLGLVASVEVNEDGETQIRFEPEQDTENASVITIDKVPQITRSVNKALMYAGVRVGSRYFIKDEAADDGYPLPLVPAMTHGQEEMFVEGTANIGSIKDLSTEICTDTNAIYDLYELGDHEDFDDKIFAIEYGDDKGTNISVQAQWFSNAYLYNRNLITGEVVNRHRWSANVYSQYGNDDDTFTAILTSSSYETNNLTATSGTISIEPFQFDNDYAGGEIEGFAGLTTVGDTNNNYGNGTIQGNPVSAANSRYTCPSAGFYFFAALVQMDVSRNQEENLTLTVTVGFKRYNSGGALQQTYTGSPQTLTIPTGSGSTSTPFKVSHNDIVFAKQNDYIVTLVNVQYEYPPISIIGVPYDQISFSAVDNSILPQQWTFFQCLATENGGGLVAAGSLDALPAEVDSFDVPMTSGQWDSIKANLTAGIDYTGQGIGNEQGWIEDVIYNHKTARATVKLRRKFNTK